MIFVFVLAKIDAIFRRTKPHVALLLPACGVPKKKIPYADNLMSRSSGR
jgi:hypothetical protein